MSESDSLLPSSHQASFCWGLLLLLGPLAAVCLTFTHKMADRDQAPHRFDIERVAHAGGIFQGRIYTNSLKAMEASAAKGFRYFEVDLTFTRDGRLACNHSWTTDKEQPWVTHPTLEEFEEVNAQRNIPQCTIYTLMQWLKDKPRNRIISDIKTDNLKALRYIAKNFRDQRFQVIPQVHRPQDIYQVRPMGFRNVIWTLYRSHLSDQQIIEWAKTLPTSSALTIPRQRAMGSLPQRLRRHGLIVYSHTINDWDTLKRIKKNGVNEVYTSSLPPTDQPPQ